MSPIAVHVEADTLDELRAKLNAALSPYLTVGANAPNVVAVPALSDLAAQALTAEQSKSLVEAPAATPETAAPAGDATPRRRRRRGEAEAAEPAPAPVAEAYVTEPAPEQEGLPHEVPAEPEATMDEVMGADAATPELTEQEMRRVLALYGTHHSAKVAGVVKLLQDYGGAKRLIDCPQDTWPTIYQKALTFLGALKVDAQVAA
jgi:hypothetical protein